MEKYLQQGQQRFWQSISSKDSRGFGKVPPARTAEVLAKYHQQRQIGKVPPARTAEVLEKYLQQGQQGFWQSTSSKDSRGSAKYLSKDSRGSGKVPPARTAEVLAKYLQQGQQRFWQRFWQSTSSKDSRGSGKVPPARTAEVLAEVLAEYFQQGQQRFWQRFWQSTSSKDSRGSGRGSGRVPPADNRQNNKTLVEVIVQRLILGGKISKMKITGYIKVQRLILGVNAGLAATHIYNYG